MKVGYVGLGKMGKNMVLRLLEQGIEVVAWNRSKDDVEEVVQSGATGAESIEELVSKLEVPRIVWLMLPAGEVTDEYIDKVLPLLSQGDLLIDGANSYYKDTLRRAKKIKPTGVHFMDIGVSGGPGGARNGACLMVGGTAEDFEKIKPLAQAAAATNAFAHFGPVGAGHFAKMVHNGVEYGMMEAVAEGAAILKASQFNFNLAQVFDLYNHRSVIESRLVEWTKQALEEDPNLDHISSKISHTGEGEWTVKTAKELGVAVPVIEGSFQVRINSENDSEDSPTGFRNKVVSAMRGKFGGHKVGKS